MTISREAIQKVARLARIHVPENDLPRVMEEVSSIIGWIEQLGEVITDSVEPLFSVVPKTLPERDDIVTDGNQQQAVLKNAPKQDYGCFVVPKVVE